MRAIAPPPQTCVGVGISPERGDFSVADETINSRILGCHPLFCKFPPDIMKLRHIVVLKFQVSIHNTANALLMSLALSVFHF